VLTGAGAEEAARRSKWLIAAQGEIDLHLGVALFDRPFVFTPKKHIYYEIGAAIGEGFSIGKEFFKKDEG